MHSKRVLTNADFENVNDYCIQLNRWFLKSIGAWPQLNAPSTAKRIAVSMQISIFAITTAIIMIPCILYVLFENVNIESKLNAGVPLIFRLLGVLNYWVLFKRNKDIYKLIQHMETDWKLVQRFDDREVMLQHARFGRFVAGMSAIFLYVSTAFFSVIRLLRTVSFTVGNETFKMYPMTCPMYSRIIDARFSPVNEILLVVQFVSSFALSSATVSICSLAAVFAMHACGQLNVLYIWLNELVEDQKKDISAENRLPTIVEHHLRVLSFIAHIENILHKVCLAEMTGSTLNMCLLGYYSLTNWGSFDAIKILSYITVYLSMSFNIFIFCYIGETLAEQCKNVGDAAYMTDWYKLPRKTAIYFVLIIMRSSKIIKMTAGKIVQLSIATFGDVIKTSMAYLNLLRTMTT